MARGSRRTGPTRYVALLRGVNVGGKNKISMPDLRAAVESAGFDDVSTFIQSGNVLFSGPRGVKPAAVESAISGAFGIDVTVMLRTADDLARVIERNPFRQSDPAKLHVGFMTAEPPSAVVTDLDGERFAPEEFVIRGLELYLHLPNGMGRAKLPPYLDRRLGVATTVRNWNTVNKLLELART